MANRQTTPRPGLAGAMARRGVNARPVTPTAVRHIAGNGTLEDIDRLEELANYIKSSSLCGLGQTAPNPVLSTLRYFRDEYIAHVVDKKCPAGVCKSLLRYKIDPAKCKGCTLCARKCPVGAISGSVREAHTIDAAKCIKCGVCMSTCKFGAISRA